MRKLASLFIIFALATSAWAVTGGYSLAVEGFSGFNQSSSVRLSGILDLTDSRYLTLEAGAGAGLDSTGLVFSGLNVDLAFRTFTLRDHIFSFLSTNPTLWSPRVYAGAMWDSSWNLAWRFGLSVFSFIDVHFTYEFLRPFVCFDEHFSWSGWGIDLIRVSYYF